MDELTAAIRGTLQESDFIDRCFPVLGKGGVRDEDVFVHSLGCSLWNTLGHELGRMAVVEAPAPMSGGADIRSDSAWFDKENGTPEVLVEFERYEGSGRCKQKLRDKVLNLMDAYHRWNGTPRVLVLSAWSEGVVSPPDTGALKEVFRRGADNSRGIFLQGIHGARLVVNRFFFEKGYGGLLRLRQISF